MINIKLVSLKSDLKKELCKYIKSDSQLLIFKITLDYQYWFSKSLWTTYIRQHVENWLLTRNWPQIVNQNSLTSHVKTWPLSVCLPLSLYLWSHTRTHTHTHIHTHTQHRCCRYNTVIRTAMHSCLLKSTLLIVLLKPTMSSRTEATPNAVLIQMKKEYTWKENKPLKIPAFFHKWKKN